MKKIADWLALKITTAVGTMFCAGLFALLAIVGFPYDDMSARSVVQWTSQTFIQLTMLSIIMVGQRLQEEHNKNRHDERIKLAHKHHRAIIKHIKDK